MLRVVSYWWLPLIAAVFWWGMLIALLACWAAQGHPVYNYMEPTSQTILFISNIAATNLQPIFISLSCAQALFFVLGLAAELYLRYIRRLRAGVTVTRHVINSLWVALILGIIGELGIIMVSIFNTRVFHTVHISMLCVFIIFVGISSLTSIAQQSFLDKDYPGKRHVVVSLVLRVIWFVVELALAIGFAVCQMHSRHLNAAGVCEWCVSFIYPFLMFIMAWDLYPAQNKAKGYYRQNGAYPGHPGLGTNHDEFADAQPPAGDSFGGYPQNAYSHNASEPKSDLPAVYSPQGYQGTNNIPGEAHPTATVLRDNSLKKEYETHV